ncbi:uncharacterized protein [Parasteatoda tepidariorum]|nr:uncharacterized protein LOC107444466 isoform X1 [Parasteatoda tepidariorum]XP_042899969.1 uncharacterized protein LOC107444466 isoform X2 [Parasteatoda tepidariorum]
MKQLFVTCVLSLVLACCANNIVLNNAVSELDRNGCACKEFTCGCCLTITVPEIKLNDTGCVKFSYLPKEYGISAALTIDQKTIINETVSARNPPPICIDPPYMDNVVHLCLRFYDLKMTDDYFHACVQLELKMIHILTIKELKIDCFNLNLPEEVKYMKHPKWIVLNMASDNLKMSLSKVQMSFISLLVTLFIPYVFGNKF